ncbi:MAG: TIGR00282 family metallophosphoesterase [Candidatus Omnitrophica bacterium]|nr:TIGR00282 family metallophosphoesterase [Candidatus Omnitrophota bacterium]MBU1871488.1 TIGR00282 family metallophosphoesterase [Candidatus Omnitrophota bacterium]
MNILFIGDIVGKPGRETVKALLPKLKKEFALDFVIANIENAAGGSGVTANVAEELFSYQIDACTSGDHIFRKKDVLSVIDEPKILRPANFPLMAPGRGSAAFKTKSGIEVVVINILGRVFMESRECPFRVVKEEIDKHQGKIVIVDFHAEASSEKVAMGWYLDGLVSAVLGTHTHIQTADEKILPKGSAYITDAGMTGPQYSVIGRKIEDVLARFITQVEHRFEVANEDLQLQGVLLDIDQETGKAKSITRIQRKLDDDKS